MGNDGRNIYFIQYYIIITKLKTKEIFSFSYGSPWTSPGVLKGPRTSGWVTLPYSNLSFKITPARKCQRKRVQLKFMKNIVMWQGFTEYSTSPGNI